MKTGLATIAVRSLVLACLLAMFWLVKCSVTRFLQTFSIMVTLGFSIADTVAASADAVIFLKPAEIWCL
jgi:hypothetical protein